MNTHSAELQRRHFGAHKVRRVVERVFQGYTGNLGARLWDGAPGRGHLAVRLDLDHGRQRAVGEAREEGRTELAQLCKR